MIYLTKEELKSIIMIRELLSKEMQTPKSNIYAWELFDDYVNLDDFTSAAKKIKEGIFDDYN